MNTLPVPGDTVFVKCVVRQIQVNKDSVQVVVTPDDREFPFSFMTVEANNVYEAQTELGTHSAN